MDKKTSRTEDFMKKVEKLPPKDQKAILMVIETLLRCQDEGGCKKGDEGSSEK